MSDDSSPEDARAGSMLYEYRVRALFDPDQGDGPVEMFTEWTESRRLVISNAEGIEPRASSVEIESRPYHSTVNFEEVPE